MSDDKEFLYPLPEKEYEHLAESFYSALLLDENAVLLFPPLFSKDHNLFQLLQRDYLKTKVLSEKVNIFTSKVLKLDIASQSALHITNQILEALEIKPVNTLELAQDTLKQYVLKSKKNVSIIVNIPEEIDLEELNQVLATIQNLYFSLPHKILFTILIDMKWDYQDFLVCIYPFRSLFQNTHFIQLYSDEATEHFIKHWLKKWSTNISKALIEKIIDHAGGILLLAKALVRAIAKNDIRNSNDLESYVISNPEYKLQVDFFLQCLTNKQLSVLKICANKQEITNTETLDQLYSMNIVSKNDFTFAIRSKSLYLHLRDTSEFQKILFHEIININTLTQREKALITYFAQYIGTIISREKIAEILWEKEIDEKYSDWSIDKTISRIREKLSTSENLKHLTINSVKKKGFILE